MRDGTTLLLLFLGFLLLQRFGEILVSAVNERRLLAQGGRRAPSDGFVPLVLVHGASFVLPLAEWWFAPWAGLHLLTLPLLLVWGLGEGLRYWSAWTLGRRWTIRVVVVPHAPLVETGPYRFLRHPIYVAVFVEMIALSLAFGLVGSALALGAANGLALVRRIRREEAALAAA